MAASEEKATANWSDRLKMVLQVVGLASPIIALLAFLGLQPEKRKALEWQYVAKSSLLNAPSTTANIKILYDDHPIRQLTTISARLANTGGTPIQSSDVEGTTTERKFAAITFDSARARILNCNVTGSNRSNVTAQCRVADNSVHIEHGLLNPGDSIGVELRLEGDPGDIRQLPKVQYRIAGISEETTTYPPEHDISVAATYPGFARRPEFILLGFGSFVPVFLFVIAIAGFVVATETALQSRKGITQLLAKGLTRVSLAWASPKVDELAYRIYTATPAMASVSWLESPESILPKLQTSAVTTVCAEAKLSLEEAARLLHRTLRDNYPLAVANALYTYLPSPQDKTAQAIAQDLKLNDQETIDAFLKRVSDAVLPNIYPVGLKKRFQLVDWGDFGLAMICLLFAITSVFITLGAWVRAVTRT